MYLLPHGRVLFTSREGLVSIYAIPTVAQKGKPWAPLHEIRAFREPLILDCTSDFRSSVHHVSPTCTTVLYSIKTPLPGRYEIVALKIPHEWSKEPFTTHIFAPEMSTPVTRVIDLFRSVAIETTFKARINVLTLSWHTHAPGELEQARVEYKQFDLPRGLYEMVYAPFGGFDAGLGRVILYSHKYSELEVYDTILQSS
jgi:hypothetical protein